MKITTSWKALPKGRPKPGLQEIQRQSNWSCRLNQSLAKKSSRSRHKMLQWWYKYFKTCLWNFHLWESILAIASMTLAWQNRIVQLLRLIDAYILSAYTPDAYLALKSMTGFATPDRVCGCWLWRCASFDCVLPRHCCGLWLLRAHPETVVRFFNNVEKQALGLVPR